MKFHLKRIAILFLFVMFGVLPSGFAAQDQLDQELEDEAEIKNTLSSNAEIASGYSAIDLGLSGDKKVEDGRLGFSSYSFSIGSSQSKSTDSVTNETTITRTRTLFGLLGISYGEAVDLSADLRSTASAQTKFEQTEYNGNLTYNFRWGSSEHPRKISIGFSGGESQIKQKVSFTILNTTVNKDLDIRGRQVGGSISFSLVDWASLSVSGQSYSYSKSKEDLQAAYKNRFLNNYASTVTSTIGGLPETSAQLRLSLFPIDRWQLDLESSTTKTLVDEQVEKTGRAEVIFSFGDKSLGIGVLRGESQSSVDTSLVASFSMEI